MPEPLPVEQITWAGLLNHWVRFAQTAVALPPHGDGPRWRDCVPHLITLQAVTLALREVDWLAVDERALAVDRSEILVSSAERSCVSAWPQGLPAGVAELIADARLALRHAQAQREASPGPR